jgi:hypothetical protein
MSTHTSTKSRNSAPEVSTPIVSTPIVSTWLDSPRELHHAEENHEGRVSDCAHCDRFELAQYSGYVDGLETWFESVGQFMDSINDTVGGAR